LSIHGFGSFWFRFGGFGVFVYIYSITQIRPDLGEFVTLSALAQGFEYFRGVGVYSGET
jgi:hypothetical protein